MSAYSCRPVGGLGAVMGDSLTALASIDGNWTDIGYAAFLRRFCGSRVDLPAGRIPDRAWRDAG